MPPFQLGVCCALPRWYPQLLTPCVSKEIPASPIRLRVLLLALRVWLRSCPLAAGFCKKISGQTEVQSLTIRLFFFFFYCFDTWKQAALRNYTTVESYHQTWAYSALARQRCFQICMHVATLWKRKWSLLLPQVLTPIRPSLALLSWSLQHLVASLGRPQDCALHLLLPPALQNVWDFLILDLDRTQSKQKLLCPVP